MADKTLDTKGLNCPLPILKAKKEIMALPPGGTLEVLATDPGSVADFQAFCRQTKHQLLEQTEAAGVLSIRDPANGLNRDQRTMAVDRPIEGLSDGQPLELIEVGVTAERTNVLGHMRAAQYVALFDDAFLAFIAKTGLTGPDLRHGTTSPFLLDLHTTYLKEIGAGERVSIAVQILDFDQRRARIILSMLLLPQRQLAATCARDPEYGHGQPAPRALVTVAGRHLARPQTGARRSGRPSPGWPRDRPARSRLSGAMSMILVSLMYPKFAREPDARWLRTSDTGH